MKKMYNRITYFAE